MSAPASEILETAPPGAAARPPFAILVAMSAVGPLALNMFVPSMPGLGHTFAASPGTVQLTLTVYLVGIAVCQLFYGPLSDRYGRRPMVLAGLALFVAASLACALAASIEMLIAARCVQAVGGAAGMILSRAIVRDLYAGEKAASVLGYITMAWVLAPMIAPSLGGFLDGIYGFRAGFWVLAGFGFLVFAAAWFNLSETNASRDPSRPLWQPEVYARLFRNPAYRRAAGSIAFASMVFFTFLGTAPFIMITLLGRSPLEYGVWFIAASIGYMTGNFVSGRYAQHFGGERMVRAGNLFTLAGALLILGFAVSDHLMPATLFLPMLLCTFGNGLTIPSGTIAAISAEPRNIGTAAGVAGFMQMALGATGSQAAGVLQGTWPLAGLWITAVAAILAAAAYRSRAG